MKIEKLEKYRKGNFVLKHEHLTAQRKLIHIRNLITRRFNLVGGDRKPVVEKLNLINNDEFMNDNTVADIITNITSNMQNEGLLVDADQQVFKELMAADRALVTEFKNYESLDSQNYNGLENPEKVKEELLSIQKSLFNLQVKIIFSKLKKITKVNIKPLLSVINNKINKMNSYIEKQEEIFTDESAPAAPQNNQSSSNTQVESLETNKNPSTLKPEAKVFEPKSSPDSVNQPAQSNGTKKSPDEIHEAMANFIKKYKTPENEKDKIDLLIKKPLTPDQLEELKQIFGDLYDKALEKEPELGNPPESEDLALLEETMMEL